MEAVFQQGLAALRSRDFAGALGCFELATAADPAHADAWLQRGIALIQLDRFAEAAEILRHRIALRPDQALGHFHRGFALTCLGDYPAARPDLERAYTLAPNVMAIHALYASTLIWCGDTGLALRHHQDLARQFPDQPAMRFRLGVLHLLLGDLASGLPLHEERLALDPNASRPELARLRRWSGDFDPAGQAMLIHGDGGLGDAIQFCRFAPMAAARGARVTLLVPPVLERLMGSLNGVERVAVEGRPYPPMALHCPMMSLPFAFGLTAEDAMPARVPYLWPAQTTRDIWSARLGPRDAPRIGLVWSAGKRPGPPDARAFNRRKSVGWDLFSRLIRVPGARFVSLQKEEQPGDPSVLDLTADIVDMEDTAGIIANLDLVISVDTSVAHLAGAMGKPVWMLNLFDTAWRWMLNRSDTPWYPSMRIFRQPAPGDWDSVVTEVEAALRTFIAAHG